MGRLLIVFLSIMVIAMAAAFYVLGLLRRFFGFTSPSTKNSFFSPSSKVKDTQKILYHTNDIVVLHGEHTSKQQEKKFEIRDASYSEHSSRNPSAS